VFNIVSKFENKIANFFGANYAVATDCCTHAIELCLRHQNIKKTSCPTHTYISIPFTFKKMNIEWNFEDKGWNDYYYLGGTNIIDAAVYWKQNGYIPNTFMCLSFQFKKHLSLGRGGAILCSEVDDWRALKKMSYDGRLPEIPWGEQNISTIGYHYYMTPETAQLGLDKFEEVKDLKPKIWGAWDYPFLPSMDVFNEFS